MKMQLSSLGAAPLALAPAVPSPPPTGCTSPPQLGSLCGSAAAGAIAGIVIGGVVLIAAIVIIVVLALTRSKTRVSSPMMPSNVFHTC